MDIKKVLMILVGIVASVIIGAAVLNVLLPNVYNSAINAIEAQVYNATGLSFDWNGDGVKGSAGGENFDSGNNIKEEEADVNGGVKGFGGGR